MMNNVLQFLCIAFQYYLNIDLIDAFDEYFSGSLFFIALCVNSYIYIIVTRKENKSAYSLLVLFSFFSVFLIICNPIFRFVFLHLPGSGEAVLPRIWLICPLWIVISFSLASLYKSSLSKWLVILITIVIIVLGESITTLHMDKKSSNVYKIKTESIEISDYMIDINNDDSAFLCIFVPVNDTPENFVVGGTIYSGISQYTGQIQVLPFYCSEERWNDYYLSDYTPEGLSTYDYIDERMVYYRRDYDFDYVVMPSDYSLREKMLYAGYAYRLSVDDYDIYEALPRWRVQSYSCYLENGEKLYLLSDNAGHFVVVGGGSSFNSNAIENVLAFCGYHVDAWILTSPSTNTLEGFNSIVKTGNCMVDHVYIPAMDTYFISEYMDECDRNAYEEFLNISETSSFELSFITEGETLEFYGMNFTFLSDLLNVQTGSVTDNSMLIRMEAGEKSFLFCSDMGYEQGQFALQKYGDELDSDYIQIASGSGMSLGLEFYKTVSPDIAFCDYLEEGDGLETYNMLVSYGIDCYCIENGDRSWIIIE